MSKIEFIVKGPDSKIGKAILFLINVLSVMVSWFFNKSILWAIFHWIVGPFYLVYRLLKGSFADGGFMEIINSYF